MKKLYLYFLFIISIVNNSSAQSIVNAYAQITSVTGLSVLAVSNVDQTNHTFTVGGQVIIMQMQDDVIGTNTTNASTFGDLSSIANAGNYEIRTILSRSPAAGTPTTITLSSTLVNTYNTGSNSRVQLISFRDLGSNFTTTANITGNAWNGNTGGVIAFYVTNTLTLQHQILADAIGFRGGAVNTGQASDLTCVNTSYRSSGTILGVKGEGIYLSTSSTFSTGRGKILNGGGGGSENNAGGGGGGNFTVGGDGGLGYPCTSANSGRGLGAISLSTSISGSRIFMGGGAGSGNHNTGGSATAGGNGGGIILIKATNLTTSNTCGSSLLISANGATANNSGQDGSGGGGAAGSIVLQIQTYSVSATCPLTNRANGGNGGSVTHSAQHGGGGGGGQGVIIYSTAKPTTNITTQTNPGSAGADNSGGTINASPGGGTAGSGTIASSSTPLPIELIRFVGNIENQKVKLIWETLTETNNDYFTIERSIDGINYSLIGKIKGSRNSITKKEYSLYDREPIKGLNYYKITQTDIDKTSKSSNLIYVLFDPPIDFEIYPNPLLWSNNCNLFLTSENYFETVVISDISGNIILEAKGEVRKKQNFQNLKLTKGLYFIVVSYGNESRCKKLVVFD